MGLEVVALGCAVDVGGRHGGVTEEGILLILDIIWESIPHINLA